MFISSHQWVFTYFLVATYNHTSTSTAVVVLGVVMFLFFLTRRRMEQEG